MREFEDVFRIFLYLFMLKMYVKHNIVLDFGKYAYEI